MACGKAAGGGILPVSFVAGRDDVIGTLTPGSEGSTFGGYPLATIVAVYAIKTLIEEQLAINAQVRGQQLLAGLYDIKKEFPEKIKTIRGKGLLLAFEMYNKSNFNGHKVSVSLMDQGVYAKETHDTTIRLAPALTINENQIDRIICSIRTVVQKL